MSWRNVSYIISITCQQSNRLSRLIVESLGRLADKEDRTITHTDLILLLGATKGFDDVLIVTSALERNAYAEDDVNKLLGTRVHEVVRRVLVRIAVSQCFDRIAYSYHEKIKKFQTILCVQIILR